ncbi:MAG: LacI family DNA-binding transcriptional regulator [Turicibacter sp.]
MKDVAKLAGVSLSTTSYALNGSNKISEATKNKVLDAAKQLNFSPNAAARSLKTKKTKIIGVILSDFIGSYYSSLLAGIQHKANEYGYDVIVISGIQTGERFIRQKLVDGMIMVNPAIEDDVIKDYANADLPFILLDRKLEGEGIYNVMINNRDAFYEIMQYHIKSGRKRIAFFSGEKLTQDNTYRYEGYLKSIQDNELVYQKVFQGNYVKNDAYDLMKDIIKEGIDFDAIACANDLMAIGVIEALREAKIKVPEEVSVSGFDNIELSEYCYPQVTTYNIDRYQWGRKASEVLMRAIQHEEGIHTHEFGGYLIERGSTLK